MFHTLLSLLSHYLPLSIIIIPSFSPSSHIHVVYLFCIMQFYRRIMSMNRETLSGRYEWSRNMHSRTSLLAASQHVRVHKTNRCSIFHVDTYASSAGYFYTWIVQRSHLPLPSDEVPRVNMSFGLDRAPCQFSVVATVSCNLATRYFRFLYLIKRILKFRLSQ